jgi:hypothetical protein
VGVLVLSVVQLIRLQRGRFDAHAAVVKKLFPVFLLFMAATRIASGLFYLLSPCFMHVFRNWCFTVFVLLNRSGNILMQCAFSLVVVFWADLLWAVSHRAPVGTWLLRHRNHFVVLTAGLVVLGVGWVAMLLAVIQDIELATMIDLGTILVIAAGYLVLGISISFYGIRIIIVARRHSQSRAHLVRTALLVVPTSLLLVFRGIWAAVVTFKGELKGDSDSLPLWMLAVWFVLGEAIPIVSWMLLMLPLPRPARATREMRQSLITASELIITTAAATSDTVGSTIVGRDGGGGTETRPAPRY